RVQVMIDAPVTSMPHVKKGDLRALAVTSKDRVSTLPDVPTLAELGLPQIDITAWSGLLVPAGTPPETIGWLNDVFTRALSDKGLQEALASQYWAVTPSSPSGMRDFLDKETELWASLVKRAKLPVVKSQ